MADLAVQLKKIAFQALERCEADVLVCRLIETLSLDLGLFESALAVGKAASAMLRPVCDMCPGLGGIAVIPEGYPERVPEGIRLLRGSHPGMGEASFLAGEEVVASASLASRPVLVLVSGGASSSLELPMTPWFDPPTVAELNRFLVRSGLPIEAVNSVRSHVSSIKGGRLGARLPSGSVTIVLSDVGEGRWFAVGSGPTTCDPTSLEEAADTLESVAGDRFRDVIRGLRSGDVPETPKEPTTECHLAGDNRVLVDEASLAVRQAGFRSVNIGQELERDVSEVVDTLFVKSRELEPGEMLVTGGEPSVRVAGSGKGGRCSELAVRWALRCDEETRVDQWALMTSSDGVDGSAPAAGYIVGPRALDRSNLSRSEILRELANSNSYEVASRIGEVIQTSATGNNLRDLFVVAKGWGQA